MRVGENERGGPDGQPRSGRELLLWCKCGPRRGADWAGFFLGHKGDVQALLQSLFHFSGVPHKQAKALGPPDDKHVSTEVYSVDLCLPGALVPHKRFCHKNLPMSIAGWRCVGHSTI
jgi:hypothetical protein